MSTPGTDVPLESLVGTRVLTGVDRDTTEVAGWGDEFQKCDVLRFTLDGVTYVACEDPDDGYRSSLRYLMVSDKPCANQFAPVTVFARMKPNGKDEDSCAQSNHTLQLLNAETAAVVLETGTDNVGDWYPWYVATFNEGNL